MQRPDQIPPEWKSFSTYLKNIKIDSADSTEKLSPTNILLNRELSWLHFNERVLGEAENEAVPTLERLRFAGIVSSNLDEFFMVRVADVIRQARLERTHGLSSKMSAQRLLTQIRTQVLKQKTKQSVVFHQLITALAKEGIQIFVDFPADDEMDKQIKENLPDLKFIVRHNTDPLPPLLSDRIHVFVQFPNEYAIVSIEERAARLLSLPSTGKTLKYILLERWLCERAEVLFPTKQVVESFPFKIIRDADLRYRPDEEESLEDQIVEAVGGRTRARVVRLEVDAPFYSEGALFLATSLRLDSAALYRFDMPLDLRTLAVLHNVPSHNQLKYVPIRPETPPFLVEKNIFDSIKKHDILLHHPYDSFEVVERFIKSAATDPNVTHIYHTMYRTNRESAIMEALKEAAKNGKKVTAYIEIKARFDELNNVRWAAELRAAGAKIIRPHGGFKVHCKLTQIFRTEEGKPTSYLHLGTGNYHSGTALQYTDLGLLTCDTQLGTDIKSYFGAMTRGETKINLEALFAAPVNLHGNFVKLIEEETRIQRTGRKGHIIAKMNSLVDENIIKALYEASTAGVKIELLVRGICCLRPGVKGLSENIKVVSIVDRFLEHSRIYYFRADGAKKVYLSSADWMPRNFYSRYEIAFPIKDAILKKYIRDVILANGLADNARAWALQRDGTYNRVPSPANGRITRSQLIFEELAKNRYKGTVLVGR